MDPPVPAGVTPSPSAREHRDRLLATVRDADPTPIGDLSTGRGAVSGTVRVHEGVREGRLSGEECVLAEYERGRNEDGRYEPVEGELVAVPFLVEDATGRVLVDPTDHAYGDGSLPISPGRTARFEGDESGENLRRVDPGEDPVLPWVHVEASIRPGDEVYAAGTVSRVADPSLPEGVDYRLAPGEDDGAFVVSDLSRPALREALTPPSRLPEDFWRFAILGAILVGAVLVVVGIFLAALLL